MDSDQGSRGSKLRPDAGEGSPLPGQRFWLEYAARSVELVRGETLIGRSSTCHIVLDDALVSRRHARLIVTEQGAKVEDLGSANGVFVNSSRVSEAAPLKNGDRIQIGKQEFALRAAPGLTQGRTGFERAMADTLQGKQFLQDFARDEGESTRRGDALELLGGVADKVLARGGGEEAERVLTSALNSTLTSVRSGAELPQESMERAAMYAAKLADATLRGRWIDYAVSLYTAYQKPLPADVIDLLYTVLRRVDAVNLAAFRVYLSVLHQQQAAFGPNERFLLQRLEGLERLAALK